MSLCTFASRQSNPHAIWHSNALWMVREDSRAGTGTYGYGCYAQKIDAAGTLTWAATGVPVYALPAAYLRPKLAPSDNGAVMAFFSTDLNITNFRAQKILPTGAVAFAATGVLLHAVADNRPYELDYVPMGQPNGSVQVFWASPGAAPTGRATFTARVVAGIIPAAGHASRAGSEPPRGGGVVALNKQFAAFFKEGTAIPA